MVGPIVWFKLLGEAVNGYRISITAASRPLSGSLDDLVYCWNAHEAWVCHRCHRQADGVSAYGKIAKGFEDPRFG